jgi:hypothetical protein
MSDPLSAAPIVEGDPEAHRLIRGCSHFIERSVSMKRIIVIALIGMAMPSLARALPDLACSITASENKNGTQPIPNGGSISYGGGNPSNWVRFKVENKGGANAKNFVLKMVVRRDGVKIYDPPAETLSLDVGASKTYPPVQINLPGITNKIEASVIVNIGGFVKETVWNNNKCTFTFKTTVVADLAHPVDDRDGDTRSLRARK